MRLRTLFTIVVALCTAVPVYAAQVYRCTDASGGVEYKDAPCASNQSGGPVKIEPNVTSGIDPRIVRDESNAIAERAAARAAADEDAARARAQTLHRPADLAPNSTPWWMVPGPPPERASGQKSGSDYTPPAGKH